VGQHLCGGAGLLSAISGLGQRPPADRQRSGDRPVARLGPGQLTARARNIPAVEPLFTGGPTVRRRSLPARIQPAGDRPCAAARRGGWLQGCPVPELPGRGLRGLAIGVGARPATHQSRMAGSDVRVHRAGRRALLPGRIRLRAGLRLDSLGACGLAGRGPLWAVEVGRAGRGLAGVGVLFRQRLLRVLHDCRHGAVRGGGSGGRAAGCFFDCGRRAASHACSGCLIRFRLPGHPERSLAVCPARRSRRTPAR